MERFNLVIVGAGVHGLLTAKTYLEVNPSAKVVILDNAKTIGGVWASERMYPGLKTNNMLGTYEFSDLPLTTERFGVKPGQHIPGPVVHEYLQQFADQFNITSRVRLNSNVQTAELKEEGGWLLNIRNGSQQETQLLTDKLVVATGLTSKPMMPEFDGSVNFGAPLIHIKELHDRADLLEGIKDLVVFGTSKSAFDACYYYARRGVQVHWAIRSSGHGPVWNAPPYVTPFRIWLEKLVLTRFLTWFSPCAYADADGYGWIRRFLHGTWFGRKLVSGFWAVLGNDLVTLTGLNKHPETKKLVPWNGPFWIASGLSIFNYETDFFELVRNGNVNVHIADINKLSSKIVHLSDGTSLPADALICSTGWVQQPPIKFLPEGIDASLGLPHYSEKPNQLATTADNEVLARFPRLRDQPPRNSQYKTLPSSSTLSQMKAPNQPYRLYRFAVPSSPGLFQSRNIAFLGCYLSVSTTTVAQAQALWITAYLGNQIPDLNHSNSSKTQENIEWETVLHSQFGKWRHPAAGGGYGERFPDMAFDSLPYVDLLLRDLGLKTHRHGGWGWREWFVPYGQGDYKGLVGEWMDEKEKGNNQMIGVHRGGKDAVETKKEV